MPLRSEFSVTFCLKMLVSTIPRSPRDDVPAGRKKGSSSSLFKLLVYHLQMQPHPVDYTIRIGASLAVAALTRSGHRRPRKS